MVIEGLSLSHQVYPSKRFCPVFPFRNTAKFLFLFHGSVFKYITVPLLTGLNHILPVCLTDLGNWASSKCLFKMYLAQFSEIFWVCFRHCRLRYPSCLHLQWKLEPDSEGSFINPATLLFWLKHSWFPRISHTCTSLLVSSYIMPWAHVCFIY